MKKFNQFVFLLVILSWVFTSAFQPLPQSASFDPSAALSVAADIGFGKVAPAYGVRSISTTAATLKWNTGNLPADVTFQYCIRTNKESCPPPKWKKVNKVTEVTIDYTLQSNTVYYWQVRAVQGNTIFYADNNVWWNFKTGNAAPGAFTKVSPANGLSPLQPANNLVLSWNTSSGTALSYNYCLSKIAHDANCLWKPVTTGTSVTVSNLDYDTVYYWQVRAQNSAGTTYADGSLASEWSFKTKIAPPGAFSKDFPENGMTGIIPGIDLKWSSSQGATSYTYCIDETNNNTCDFGQINVLPATSTFVTPTLLTGKTYYWQVFAHNSGGDTQSDAQAVTSWHSFTTVPVIPATFTKTSPTNGAVDQSVNLELSWSSPDNPPSGFQYCISTSQSCTTSWTAIDKNAPIKVAVGQLAYGTTYYWQVRAGAATEANGGSWWSFTTEKMRVTQSTINNGNPLILDEDTSLTAQVSSNSNYPASTSFVIVQGLTGLGITSNLDGTGTLLYVPPANYHGTQTFSYRVNDGQNFSDIFTATITVNSIEDTPILPSVNDLTIQPGEVVDFPIIAVDGDIENGEAQTLTYSLFGTTPAGASIETTNDKQGAFYWATAADVNPGPYVINVRVIDSTGRSDTLAFTITVAGIPVTGGGGFVYIPMISR